MTPYYEDEWVIIYHGDCRELVDELEFDVVLTDPPYGNETAYRSGIDDSQEALKTLVGDVMPMLLGNARGVVALTPGNGNQALYPQPTWTIAWVVPAGTGRSPWGFTCWQPVLVYGKDPYLAAGRGARPDIIVWTETAQYKDDHPCPKPEKFWRALMQRVSINASDVILDPFVGVGTTLRVAKDLGHRAIGIELDERYCEIAATRCGQEVLPIFETLEQLVIQPDELVWQ